MPSLRDVGASIVPTTKCAELICSQTPAHFDHDTDWDPKQSDMVVSDDGRR